MTQDVAHSIDKLRCWQVKNQSFGCSGPMPTPGVGPHSMPTAHSIEYHDNDSRSWKSNGYMSTETRWMHMEDINTSLIPVDARENVAIFFTIYWRPRTPGPKTALIFVSRKTNEDYISRMFSSKFFSALIVAVFSMLLVSVNALPGVSHRHQW